MKLFYHQAGSFYFIFHNTRKPVYEKLPTKKGTDSKGNPFLSANKSNDLFAFMNSRNHCWLLTTQGPGHLHTHPGRG